MSDYTKIVNYAAKDALIEGDPNKIIKGSELDAEFVAIQTAVATKSNVNSPLFTGIPRAPTAAFGTNTTQVATTAFVQQNGVPIGGIIMWSGTIVNIPQGYALCDGTNGTPDLRGKFIVGAGGSYAPEAIGGAATKTLETANLPPHTHTFTTDTGGNHTHSVSDPGHEHVQRGYTGFNGGNNYGFDISVAYVGVGQYSTGTSMTNISLANHAGHTHTGTTASTGTGTAIDILPPYFALAYIMRTA